VAQQTLCEQNPDVHSASLAQLWSWEPQVPFRQGWPGAQSAGAAQVVLQVVPEASHANGAHDCATAAWQVPALSHVRAVVKVPFAQTLAAQTVPAGSAVQVPTWPARVQLAHPPAQALVQQTPSVQKPDTHSWLPVHGVAIGFLGMHSSSPAQ
jgi:hypothetical protein